MKLTFYGKALIVLWLSTEIEEAVTPPPPTVTSMTTLKTYKSLISTALFYASESWHPQETYLTKMQCFQTRVSEKVTTWNDNRNRLMEKNILPEQMVSVKVSPFFMKIVIVVSVSTLTISSLVIKPINTIYETAWSILTK